MDGEEGEENGMTLGATVCWLSRDAKPEITDKSEDDGMEGNWQSLSPLKST